MRRRNISNTIALVTAQCSCPDCAAVMNYRIAHDRDVTPPLSDLTNSLYEQIAQLSAKEKADIFKTFAPGGIITAPVSE